VEQKGKKRGKERPLSSPSKRGRKREEIPGQPCPPSVAHISQKRGRRREGMKEGKDLFQGIFHLPLKHSRRKLLSAVNI